MYINEDTARWLKDRGSPQEKCSGVVCSGLGSGQQFCLACKGRFSFQLRIFNDLLGGDETYKVTAGVIASPYPVLLSRKFIKENNISLKCLSYFSNLTSGAQLRDFVAHYTSPYGVATSSKIPTSINSLATRQPSPPSDVRGGDLRFVSALSSTERPKSDFLTPEPDEEYILPTDESTPWDEVLSSSQTQEIEDLPEVHGSPEFKAKIIALIREFSDVFSRELASEPADLPPLDVSVDKQKWEVPKNQGRARPTSGQNQTELRRQLAILQSCKVIESITGVKAYSQVLLVKKPGTEEKRMCIDYRALNECIGHMNWPLPNILHMVDRIGQRKPKNFAKFDMTKGYWQLALSNTLRLATAFITAFGIFVWNRIPMGLQPASSYFQYCMTTVVLAGLMYEICESYIDDIIVHGQHEQDLATNLRTVFERFRRYKIKLNPKKSVIGLQKIEYVGHQIDADGMHFTKEKLSEVATFATPQGAKGLRSFLGLTQYFSAHVPKYAIYERPLRDVLKSHDKTKRFVWTVEAQESFVALQKAVSECPKLYFLSDNPEHKVFLRTDACEYGYGAYLFQIVEGQEHPILFLSRSFQKAQIRWQIQDKECFAIYMALDKFQYLLHSRPFVLQTDSRNLTFLNNAASSRVYRWKLAIQRYDFTIEHIPGSTNIVADAFSRLVPDWSMDEGTNEVYCISSLYEVVIPRDHYKMISKVHNSNTGHFGVERTVQKLHQMGIHWPHMRETVRAFIRKCPCCQKMSYLKVPIIARRFTVVAKGPMETLNIDFMGPFPPDEYNNVMVLVIIDSFTRAVGLYAVPEATAKETARMLIRHIGIFGCPSKIVSDMGTQFTSDVIKELMILFGTDHTLTLVGSKQEDSQVENANKRSQEFLRAMLFDRRIVERWSDVLPLVQRIMMAEPNEVTGISPAELLFGNMIQLDRGIFLPQLADSEHVEIALSDWADKMFSSQRILLDIAMHRQERKDLRHMKVAPANVTTYEIGSYVLMDPTIHNAFGKPSGKFTPRLLGPYLVVNRINDKYSCRNLVDDAVKDFHVTQLRPYQQHDENFMDPRDVALRDRGDYEIDKIVEHQGDITKLKTLKFRVKWYGFTEDDFDTWESWSNLRETVQLHRYLIANNMKQLIPKKFHENYPSEFPPKSKSNEIPNPTEKHPHKCARNVRSEEVSVNKRGKGKVRISRDVVVLKRYKKKPTSLFLKEKRYIN